MTHLVLVLIFAVFYPLMSIAVWSAGAFGIGATISDRRERAIEKARRRYPAGAYSATFAEEMASTGEATAALVAITFAAGLLRLPAIPIYLAFRKGRYFDRVVEKRDAAVVELKKRADAA